VAFHASSSRSIDLTKIIALTLFGAILIGLLFVFCCVEDSIFTHRSHQDETAPKTPPNIQHSQQQQKEKPQRKEMSYPDVMGTPGGVAADPPNTKANLLRIASTQSTGTWVKTYRNADANSKEALELLFRCNVIPTEEFAHSYVSQEHIDECVWISTQMLRQKSLEEWVDAWPQAMKTFEESVTACFAARTDVIANLYGNSPGSTARGPNPNSPNSPPGSDRGLMDCRTPGVPSPAPQHRSNPSTMNTLTAEKHLPSSDPQLRSGTYVRSNVSTAKALSEEQLPPSMPSAVSMSQSRGTYGRSIEAHRGPPSAPQSPPPSLARNSEEFQELLAQEAGRSAVVARCRDIMRENPTPNDRSR